MDAMNSESKLLEKITKVSEIFKTIKISIPDKPFIVSYCLKEFDDDNKVTRSYIKEDLTKYMTYYEAINYIRRVYPDFEFSGHDVKRFLRIVRTLIFVSNSFDFNEDETIEIGHSSSYGFNEFPIRRSKLLEHILTGPKISIICCDTDDYESLGLVMRRECTYDIIDIVHKEILFEYFLRFWEGIGVVEENTRTYESLDYTIDRKPMVIKEARKVYDSIVGGMEKMTKLLKF
jgi:hypothetical protein